MTRVRRPANTAGSGEQPQAPDGKFHVAAFGDSLMWGQGNDRDKRFAHLITEHLAAAAGRKPSIDYDLSRSGACINSTRADAAQFVDKFPHLFGGSRQVVREFLDRDYSAAVALYGEIPATFPTVTWQVDRLSPRKGRIIDLALVSGGGNDIGLDTLLDPDEFEGGFVPKWDGLIERIAFSDTFELLSRVRDKCPNAVIMLFGYFAPFSSGSPLSKMRSMAKYFYGNDVYWQINRAINLRDVTSLLREMQARAEWAIGRALFWQKRAVVEANRDADVRGPGVLYIPSGFLRSNSVFGSDPKVWGRYQAPLDDDMHSAREQQIVRADEVGTLSSLSHAHPETTARDHPHGTSYAELRALGDKLTGPSKLVALTKEGGPAVNPRPRSGNDGDVSRYYASIRSRAAADIARIDRARIASFLHPNHAGSKQYADMAVRRYEEWQTLRPKIVDAERSLPRPTLPQGPETTSELLTRFGLRSSGSLLRDISHLDVDSLAIRAETASSSDFNLGTDVYLTLETTAADGSNARKQYRLNMRYRFWYRGTRKFYPEFEPGTTGTFMIDLGEPIRLERIQKISLEMGPSPELPSTTPSILVGETWRPRRIILFVDSRSVVDRRFIRRTELKAGDTLSLRYPPPRRGSGPVIVD